jgi:hypothetical protein
MIDQHIKEGQLVPAELVVQLLRRAMDANLARGNHLFLIDGQQHHSISTPASIRLPHLPSSRLPLLLCAVQVSHAELRTSTAGIA